MPRAAAHPLRHVALALGLMAWAAAAHAFGFDDVAARARADAAMDYRPPLTPLPDELAALDYDQYRDIRFRPDKALWRSDKLPFEATFFHLGYSQRHAVILHEVTPDGARAIPFDAADFDYGHNRLSPSQWGDVGYAGFRAFYQMNTPGVMDEVIAFLGASYFRAIGAGQLYGLSARGLAIDTVGGRGEEFPRFKEFWLQRPSPDATQLTLFALLDSPRATGAYEFVVRPGPETQVDVRMRLYLRAGVSTLGIAPLTSMYDYGENDPRPGRFRPEVHDSDGLMLAAGDGQEHVEWLWRPLRNPTRTLTSSFQVKRLHGFGLMQRDRAFTSYEDTEAHYEKRPSAWITPVGDWGPGRVELVQIPAADETEDNIVAYWVPEKAPAKGEALDLSYRIAWQGDSQQRPPNGWTVQSRAGRGYKPLAANELQYVVDFAGPAIERLAPDSTVEANVTPVRNARVLDTNVFRNDATGGWRMTLTIARIDPAQPVELRAFLSHDHNALTETWTSLIAPD